ncbi:hypothetical protein GCM10023259_008220 [Thermocatellispora tengchongensis]
MQGYAAQRGVPLRVLVVVTGTTGSYGPPEVPRQHLEVFFGVSSTSQVMMQHSGFRAPRFRAVPAACGTPCRVPRFQGADHEHNSALPARLEETAAAKGASFAQPTIA